MESHSKSSEGNSPAVAVNHANDFLLKYLEAQMILADPEVQQVYKKLSGTQTEEIKKITEQAEIGFNVVKQNANAILKEQSQIESSKDPSKVYIYIDGCFDLPHSGHYNAIRQAKGLGDYLYAGVNSDKDVLETKGPSVLNSKERCEIIKHCKFVDKVIPDAPYALRKEFVVDVGCDFWAHGDDPCIDKNGVDVCQYFRDINMFKEFKRTEGVSTTTLTAKLLTMAEQGEKVVDPPKQTFLQTSRRIVNFANQNIPKEKDTIVYIQGSFDLLHHGHMRRLELAKQLGDFLYVGLWDDDLTKYYKGECHPVQSIQERVLQVLACKHVDDVVIGAPFIITKDLITSLKIKKVVVIIDTEEDTVSKDHRGIDQFAIARDLGILQEVKVDDPFFDITVEKIAERVQANRAQLELKVLKKTQSENHYYETKVAKTEM